MQSAIICCCGAVVVMFLKMIEDVNLGFCEIRGRTVANGKQERWVHSEYKKNIKSFFRTSVWAVNDFE